MASWTNHLDSKGCMRGYIGALDERIAQKGLGRMSDPTVSIKRFEQRGDQFTIFKMRFEKARFATCVTVSFNIE